jgi:DMSO/TMAO reductase YedYZ molybdopterin-dependent catalytic subunit
MEADRQHRPHNTADLIVRESEPVNLEFPFPTLDSFLIPNHRFFVRTHFGIVADLDLQSWRLIVEGRVERQLQLSYDDLLRMPPRSLVALLECAGNGRQFLTPKTQGLQWEAGAVGNAEWTGVPLAAILDRAGLKADAVEVVLEGADAGEVNVEPKSPGPIHYSRSLPLDKARQPEVLLAYKMNGAELTADRGFPVRAIVPGWYGMASVKWLRRIVVTAQPFNGYYQSLEYSYFEKRDGLQTLVPLTEMMIKAQIAQPIRGEIVPLSTPYRVFGAAWAGDDEVAQVEVSTDSGKTWDQAILLDKPVKYAWRLWEYPWQPSVCGKQTLAARATDTKGRVQPIERDCNHRSYAINHIIPVEVEVR